MSIQLFPKVKTPYYIMAPAYTHKSSGVRALHLLVHCLNESGQMAYLLPCIPYAPGNYTTHPYLNTPVISRELEHINFYGESGIDPILVYPDIVDGNPFSAKRVVRYILAPAGTITDTKNFADTDQVWAYTTPMAKQHGTDRVLLIPTFDTNIFYRPFQEPYNTCRVGSCFYSHKYDKIHGNKLLPVTENFTRLDGSPEEIAEILRRNSVCYVYEMSEVIVNAGLCGCPVVLIRTPYFNHVSEELDFDFSHVRWNDEEKPITFDKIHQNIKHLSYEFEMHQLPRFIHETQRGIK